MTETPTTGTGRGKIILLGEHAVVYGHAALAGALALDVYIEASPAARNRLVVPEWGIDTDSDPDGGPKKAFEAIARAITPTGTWSLTGAAKLPARAGLGSSAALSVAIARALLADQDIKATQDRVCEFANQGERVFHGQPSGVDVALAARGGIGLFRRQRGLLPITCVPFPIAVALSGVARDTVARVNDVKKRRDESPATINRILQTLGELAEQGVRALEHGETDALGPLFDVAHQGLRRLGVSSDRLDELCLIAKGASATGAKLTGAGGGGAVIAVGNVQAVVNAWRSAGVQAFVTDVGCG